MIQDYTNINSVDELIKKMRTTPEGFIINELSDIESFKWRLIMFEKYLAREFPDFNFEELIKAYENIHKLNGLLKWEGLEYLLNVIDYKTKKS